MADHRVKPDTKVRLKDYDANDTDGYKDRDKAEEEVKEDIRDLAKLQERLYAENKRALLVVLQAMDTGGKDGTVKHVFSGVNPAGCQVTNFKKPSDNELDHDYLWRIHNALPAWGNIGIFNRSHYEEVLVVRVHNMVPPEVWKARYDQINRFEAMVSELGITILKFFLHIDKDEQKRRLQDRLDDADKTWKFSEMDIAERMLWDQYQEAYEDALSKCSTKTAPWYIVPANKKWYRNLVVARTIVNTLKEMDPHPPKAKIDLKKVKAVLEKS